MTIPVDGGSVVGISDEAYGPSWSGDTGTAASKNALYNKIETLGGGATLQSAYDAGSSITTTGVNGAVTFQNGVIDDTTSIFTGKNNAGDITFLLRGDGSVGIGSINPQSKLNIDYGTTALDAKTDIFRTDFVAKAGLNEGAAAAKISLGEAKAGLSTTNAGSMDFEVNATIGLSELDKTYRFIGENPEQNITLYNGNIGLGKDYADTKIHIDYGSTGLTSATDVLKTDFTIQVGPSTTLATAKLTLGANSVGPTQIAAASMDFDIDPGSIGPTTLNRIYRFIGEDAARTVTIRDGRLGIGNDNPASTLDISGSISKPIETITTNTLLDNTHSTILVDAASGDLTIDLPAATACKGRLYCVKKIDSTTNTITIDGNGTETIDGDLVKQINIQYVSITIQSDGSNWYIIAG